MRVDVGWRKHQSVGADGETAFARGCLNLFNRSVHFHQQHLCTTEVICNPTELLMSFEFIIGDFVAAGQLAFEVHKECSAVKGDYVELAEVCRNINVAINACSPNDPRSVLKNQDAESISIIGADCLGTLERLQSLLAKYDDLNSLQNISKELSLISAEAERHSIRKRLQEHLAAINTFMSGAQLDTTALIVWRLLLSIVKIQDGVLEPFDLKQKIDSPAKLQGLFKELVEGSKVLESQLDKRKDAVQDKLNEAIRDPDILLDLFVPNPDDDTGLEGTTQATQGPAEAKTTTYDLNFVHWFAVLRPNLLLPVSVSDAKTLNGTPSEPLMRYSEEDEFLCALPEGWSMVPTLRKRGPNCKLEEAYYYSFNNLSCSKDNRSRNSRAYFHRNPFMSYSSQPWSHNGLAITPTARFAKHHPTVASPTNPLAMPRLEDCAG